MQGGIIDKDMPLPVRPSRSSARTCGPTRIGMRVDEAGRKLRVCKCGTELYDHRNRRPTRPRLKERYDDEDPCRSCSSSSGSRT